MPLVLDAITTAHGEGAARDTAHDAQTQGKKPTGAALAASAKKLGYGDCLPGKSSDRPGAADGDQEDSVGDALFRIKAAYALLAPKKIRTAHETDAGTTAAVLTQVRDRVDKLNGRLNKALADRPLT